MNRGSRWPVFLLALLAAMLPAESLRAQSTGTIAGRITDERTGQPLPGAQIFVEVNRASRSDQDGRYRLGEVAAGSRIVSVRMIGYANKEVPITVTAGQTLTTNITLAVRPLNLDAMVVTGQGGEISQRRIATTVDVISRETIEASPARRLDEMLQTNLPSAQIRMTSGQPGTTSIMRTRGVTSVSNNSTPVIYVDGVRQDNLNTIATLGMNVSGVRSQGAATSALADLPLDNIERIEFIPGGAATTLYGSDAANGVIQIFTKRGVNGATKGFFETRLGYDTPGNAAQFHFFDRTRDLLYRNGLTQTYNAGIEGGNNNITYSLSGNLRANESHRLYGDNSSFGVRSAIGANLGTKGRYQGSFAYNETDSPRFRNGNAGGYTSLWVLEAGRSNAFGFNNNIDALNAADFAKLKTFVDNGERLQDNRVFTRSFQSSQRLDFDPIPSVKTHVTFGLNNRFSKERASVTNEFLIATRTWPVGTTDRGTIQNFERSFNAFTFDVGGQHSAALGSNLSVITSVGAQLFRNDDVQVAYTGTNVIDGALTITGAAVTQSSDLALRVANYGIFAQTNISYMEKYTMELGVRADKNTAFGANTGAQVYPKIGLVYALGAEPWLRKVLSEELLSDIRLRAAYGVAGQFPQPFANDRTVTINPFLGQQAATFGQPGNINLRPERTGTFEIGADLSFLQERATLGLGWYTSRTVDALLTAPPAPSTGEVSQISNVGVIANNGLELRGTVTPVSNSSWRLTLNGAFNTLNNKVVSLGGAPPFPIGGFGANTVQGMVQEGYPVGFLRGTKAIFDTDGKLTEIQRLQYLGSAIADKFGSFGAQLGIGSRLTFLMSADYQFGAQALSFDKGFRFLYGVPGTENYVPAAAVAQAPYNGNRASIWLQTMNLWVENTDYVALRTLTADYRVPERLLPGGAKSLRVAFSVTNPWRWASSSFDPETDLSSATTQGGAAVGGFNYATDGNPRTFLLTFRFGF
ncbi:TonB-dependent receptor domain-containing protein [Gemmatimonas sp.]|uniref:TonB-dependent receptor domain-containing protein n=1 Tax=Gemmatimonas sp. TaxID=1962908 RepID=UPI0035638F48